MHSVARSPAPPLSLVLLVGLTSCGSAPSAPFAPELQIVTASGAPLHAVAGDGLLLKVVQSTPDGGTQDLSSKATVAWTLPGVVTTLPPGATASSPLPTFGSQPSAAWIDNAIRSDRAADLANVLFVLDPGTVQNGVVQVSATVSGAAPSDDVTASIAIDPTPAGDWTRGATLYGSAGADCASCHGPTGHGGADAPCLDAEPGGVASDPAWNAALFAVAARADMNKGGVALRLPMPDWLAATNPATGQPLTTQDFADIYAFLKTQTQ
jgi:hypothetical protein